MPPVGGSYVMPAPFSELDVAFIAGPQQLGKPMSSVALDDAVDYTPETITKAFLSVQGCRIAHPAEPSWWDWRAKWVGDGGSLALDMSLFDVEPPLWGGSVIQLSCTPHALFSFWQGVRRHCPAVYLHDTFCTIYPPHYFAQLYLSRPS